MTMFRLVEKFHAHSAAHAVNDSLTLPFEQRQR